jgi:hypothetical protein
MEATTLDDNGTELVLQQMWCLNGFPITIKKYEVSALPYQFLTT